MRRTFLLLSCVAAGAAAFAAPPAAAQDTGIQKVASSPPPSSGSGIEVSALANRNLPVIHAGEQVAGMLSSNSVLRNDDTYMNGYIYNGVAGEKITITLRSADFDSWLVVDQPDGRFRQWDDDSGGGRDARLTATLPATGRYVIAANSVAKRSTGRYTLRVDQVAPGATSTTASSTNRNDFTALASRSLPVIHTGEQVEGMLTTNSFLRSDDTYANGYLYRGVAGERIIVTLRSADFDSWLVMDQP